MLSVACNSGYIMRSSTIAGYRAAAGEAPPAEPHVYASVSRDVGCDLDHLEVVLTHGGDLHPPSWLQVREGREKDLKTARPGRLQAHARKAASLDSRLNLGCISTRSRLLHLRLSREGGEPLQLGSVLQEVVHLHTRLPWTRVGRISAASRLHLGCISP